MTFAFFPPHAHARRLTNQTTEKLTTNYTDNPTLAAAFPVSSQTSDNDKSTFLALQDVTQQHLGDYRYLEIGSYLGGTLSPHLRSPACKGIFSIDIRIDTMWDERNRVISYEGVSTDQMLNHLALHHDAQQLEKLTTSDTDSSVLTSPASNAAGDADAGFELALIDGEHTNPAVFYDFLNVRPVMKPNSIIMFHDSNIVWQGLKNIRTLLQHEGGHSRFLYLPDNVGALFLGEWPSATIDRLTAMATDADAFEDNARTFIIRQTIRSNLKLAKRLTERFLTQSQ